MKKIIPHAVTIFFIVGTISILFMSHVQLAVLTSVFALLVFGILVGATIGAIYWFFYNVIVQIFFTKE